MLTLLFKAYSLKQMSKERAKTITQSINLLSCMKINENFYNS
jgi:hypothetical protein